MLFEGVKGIVTGGKLFLIKLFMNKTIIIIIIELVTNELMSMDMCNTFSSHLGHPSGYISQNMCSEFYHSVMRF